MTTLDFKSDGRQLVFTFLVKKKKKNPEQTILRGCQNSSGVKVEAASKKAAGTFLSDSVVFKDITLPHSCFQETEQTSKRGVYFFPKYTLRLLGYVYKVESTVCATVVYKFSSTITSHTATE